MLLLLNKYKVYIAIFAIICSFAQGWYLRGVFYRSNQVKELTKANESLVKSQAVSNEIAGNAEDRNIQITKEAIEHAEEYRVENEKNPINCSYSAERVRLVNKAFSTR